MFLKQKFLGLLLSLSLSVASGQSHEIGIFFGGSNFIGDVGNTQYVAPNSGSIGLFYRGLLFRQIHIRAGINTSQLNGYDTESNLYRRKNRGFSIENNIIESYLGLEMDFLDFELKPLELGWTTYMFLGLSYLQYQKGNFNNNNTFVNYGKDNTFALPFGIGLKMKISEKIMLGIEVLPRYTFSNSIDGSTDTTFSFGNKHNNDWFVFTGGTINYIINPCLCKTKKLQWN